MWSFEALTRRCPRGWNASDQTLESWACERVARGGDIGCEKDGSGVARSQCRTAPSEPPETSRGCTGCHVTARLHKLADSVWRDQVDVQQTSFL